MEPKSMVYVASASRRGEAVMMVANRATMRQPLKLRRWRLVTAIPWKALRATRSEGAVGSARHAQAANKSRAQGRCNARFHPKAGIPQIAALSLLPHTNPQIRRRFSEKCRRIARPPDRHCALRCVTLESSWTMPLKSRNRRRRERLLPAIRLPVRKSMRSSRLRQGRLRT
jgi:hypothetical protein